MDVDNSKAKPDGQGNAPVDASGQLTQPMRKDVQNMIKNQKTQQWGRDQHQEQPKQFGAYPEQNLADQYYQNQYYNQ